VNDSVAVAGWPAARLVRPVTFSVARRGRGRRVIERADPEERDSVRWHLGADRPGRLSPLMRPQVVQQVVGTGLEAKRGRRRRDVPRSAAGVEQAGHPTARNDTSRSRGIASTVEDQKRAFGGLDLFLAGDQRDRIRACAIGDLVVDLARQQTQRQADHAGGMRQHPLDREMGLAGVGRPEHGGNGLSLEPVLGRTKKR